MALTHQNGHSALVQDAPEPTLGERFAAAAANERVRAAALELPLELDAEPDDFDAAVANVNLILGASARGTIDPYAAAINVMGQVLDYLADEVLAEDLYVLWAELSDVVELCDPSRDAEATELLRTAAKEWHPDSGDDDRAAYFARWESVRGAWDG